MAETKLLGVTEFCHGTEDQGAAAPETKGPKALSTVA